MIYLYPNRPILYSVDAPEILKFSYDPNFVAEIKKNGDRLCLQKENGKFLWWNRHKELLKRYTPIDEVLDELNSLNIPDITQLDAELLHNHTKTDKHHLYFYDVYLWGGEYNHDTLRQRRVFLENLFAGKKFKHLELAIQYVGKKPEPNTTVSTDFDWLGPERKITVPDFQQLYYKVIPVPENEGLVIKNLNGKLIFNTAKSNDVDWQIKIRREHKNYKF
jgi:hypothetical protein